MKFFRDLPNCAKPVGPYSPAVAVGEFLFCSGQIALDPDTGALVPGGIAEQTTQVLKNIRSLVHGAGSSTEKIVMTTIFLSDMAQWKTVNELYGRFVSSETPPARQTVAVKDLPLGALVEISVIAKLG